MQNSYNFLKEQRFLNFNFKNDNLSIYNLL